MSFQISITPEEIEKLPLEAFGGKIHVISKEGPEYDRAVRYLLKQKIVGAGGVRGPDSRHLQRRS